jgi:hypothetical protein
MKPPVLAAALERIFKEMSDRRREPLRAAAERLGV